MIISQYRYKEFQEIPEERLHEFVGPIITEKDRAILQTWINHLKSMNIPFILVKRKDHLKSKDRMVTANFLICERKA